MGVKVGSGVKVAVAVLVAGITVGRDVDAASTGLTGVDIDVAGLAQADINMISTNNRETLRFMMPLLVGETKGRARTPALGFHQQ